MIKPKKEKVSLKNRNSILTIAIILVLLVGLLLLVLNWLQVLIVVAVISGFIILYEVSNNLPFKKKKKSKSKYKKKTKKRKKPRKSKNSSSKNSSKSKSSSKNKGTKKIRRKRKVWKILLAIFLGFAIIGVLGAAALIMYVVREAPEFIPSELYSMEATEVFASDGTLIAKLGREKRQNVTYDELPEVLIDAIISTEDARYFQHNGLDLPRFVKATVGQLMGNTYAGGASTLTMQISKNKITNTDQTVIRKLTDVYMAIWVIEKSYTKEEIMEFYVNSPYLGGGAYGVEQACQNFFDKSVSDINLAEASLIAGLFQAPGGYDPFLHPEAAETRRQTVLYLMQRHGYITEEEHELAKIITVEKLLVDSKVDEIRYQGYVDTVVEEVLANTGLNPYDVPMIIETNMDVNKQKHVDKVLAGDGGFKFRDDEVQSGFVVTEVDTGKVVALGAGRNREGERSFNYATMAKRQPGSTAKPLFDYGPAFEYNNWSTYHPILDEKYTYSNGVKINNWDNKHLGLMTLRQAFSQSRNIPALKTFQSVDNKKIIEFVTKLGIEPEITKYGGIHEAHAIGGFDGITPYQSSGAFAAFANGGYFIEPYTVSKITYKATDETISYNPAKERVMKASTAYLVNKCITMSTYSNGKNIVMAAKTGTTNLDTATEKAKGLPSNTVQDAWVVGYTPNYSMSMWYGYASTSKEHYLTTSIAWVDRKALFIALSTGITEVDGSKFPTTSTVISVKVEKETWPAAKPSSHTPSNMIVTEYFIKGTQPTATSKRFSTLNNVNNLSAIRQGNNVSITWNYDLPTHLTDDYLDDYYKNLYGEFKNKYLDAREAYDASVLGTMQFKVYRKNADGSLTLLDTTTGNSYAYSLTSNATVSFVVKTTYSKFKNNISAGSGLTINPFDVEIINMTLNGLSTVTLTVGDVYTEEDPSVTVLNNLVDVTSESVTTYSILRASDSTVVASINTSTPDTYTITYTTTYDSTTEVNERIVVVEEEIIEEPEEE